MLLKVDAKAIEWRVKVFLSQDKVAIQEIKDGVDIHSLGQKTFNLPSRLVAKVLNFRMIFADAFSEQSFIKPAWSYANDPDFAEVSTSQKYWANIVARFFTKYDGMYTHGWRLIDGAKRTGFIEVPSGRVWNIEPTLRDGVFIWPNSVILNYPVQGLSADILMLARLELKKRIRDKKINCLLINTVHDDIECDVQLVLDKDLERVYTICLELENLFSDLPKIFEKVFGVVFNIPLMGEVSFGNNLKEMWEFKKENGPEQFRICKKN